MKVINKPAVDALCAVVGLDPNAVSALQIHVELPGVVTAKAEFYVLPKPETTTKKAAKK